MQRKPRAYALTVMVLALSVSAIAQSEHPVTPSEDTSSLSMADQLAELRAQVARLEAALQQNHQGHTGEQKSHDKKKLGMGGGSKHEGEDMSGMSMDKSMTMTETGMSKGMKMGGTEMGVGKMKGMQMMGMMKGGSSDQDQADRFIASRFSGCVTHLPRRCLGILFGSWRAPRSFRRTEGISR